MSLSSTRSKGLKSETKTEKKKKKTFRERIEILKTGILVVHIKVWCLCNWKKVT